MMEIVLATENNIELIGQLAKEIWYDHYITIIGEAQVNYMLNKLYSDDALQNQMREGQLFYIIQPQNPIGFFAYTKRSSNEWFLNKFYIKTNEQGKGIGQNILNQVLTQMPKDAVMRLQVNRQNYKSINFYFKMGFVIETVADFDIGDGYYMNDFVMIKA